MNPTPTLEQYRRAVAHAATHPHHCAVSPFAIVLDYCPENATEVVTIVVPVLQHGPRPTLELLRHLASAEWSQTYRGSRLVECAEMPGGTLAEREYFDGLLRLEVRGRFQMVVEGEVRVLN
jgi:hypothetical protein